jgi:hypothetical protein
MRRWLQRVLGGLALGVVLFAIIAPTIGTPALFS